VDSVEVVRLAVAVWQLSKDVMWIRGCEDRRHWTALWHHFPPPPLLLLLLLMMESAVTSALKEHSLGRYQSL